MHKLFNKRKLLVLSLVLLVATVVVPIASTSRAHALSEALNASIDYCNENYDDEGDVINCQTYYHAGYSNPNTVACPTGEWQETCLAARDQGLKDKDPKTQAGKPSNETPANITKCDQYKDVNLRVACESGYGIGIWECDRYDPGKYKEACRNGVSIIDAEEDKTPSQKDKQKAEKAEKVVNRAEKQQKAAKKAVDKAKKEVKKACDKDKNSKACKNAQKALDNAKQRLKDSGERLGTAKATAATLRSIASTGGCKYKTFFGIKPWYAYLGDEFSSSNDGVNQGDPCTLKCFNFLPQEENNACGVIHSDIPYVLLAIVDGLLRVSGLIAVIFVIVGATKYITSQGEPEGVANAQSTVLNALIGMAIAIVAIALISFATRNIG